MTERSISREAAREPTLKLLKERLARPQKKLIYSLERTQINVTLSTLGDYVPGGRMTTPSALCASGGHVYFWELGMLFRWGRTPISAIYS